MEKIKLHKKSEWFAFNKPLAEPNERWSDSEPYFIERLVDSDGSIVWFGCSINWKKEPGENWKVYTINEDSRPLEKYLPEIVYSGEDRMMWVECDPPIYEKLYLEYYEKELRKWKKILK
jgi:hypothetical protein